MDPQVLDHLTGVSYAELFQAVASVQITTSSPGCCHFAVQEGSIRERGVQEPLHKSFLIFLLLATRGYSGGGRSICMHRERLTCRPLAHVWSALVGSLLSESAPGSDFVKHLRSALCLFYLAVSTSSYSEWESLCFLKCPEAVPSDPQVLRVIWVRIMLGSKELQCRGDQTHNWIRKMAISKNLSGSYFNQVEKWITEKGISAVSRLSGRQLFPCSAFCSQIKKRSLRPQDCIASSVRLAVQRSPPAPAYCFTATL